MTSTDSVELTGVNTRLPWKPVAKGSRSATRRTRKQATQSTMPEAWAEDKTAGEVSTAATAREVEATGVSDSEKHGVAVLGRHFAEGVENVPIKKRRFVVCSPSPSKRSSPHHEGSEHRAQINNAVYVSRLNPGLNDGGLSQVACHDFSGIHILAEVACNSDVINDSPPSREYCSVDELEQQQNPTTSSVPVKGDELLVRTSVHENVDKVGKGEIDSAVSLEHTVVMEDNSSAVEHSGVASEKIAAQNNSCAVSDKTSWERPGGNVAAGEAESSELWANVVSVVEKSAAIEHEKIPYPKDDRLHWDLNLSIDDWMQPCDVEYDTCRRDADGEVTESGAHAESEPIDNINNHVDGPATSEGHGNISIPSEINTNTDAQNSKDFQSGYDSQYEDGELRESYPCWDENEGDAGEIEEVDYDSDPEDERFYSVGRTDESKMEDGDRQMIPEVRNRPRRSESGDGRRSIEASEGGDIEKHVVVCMNDPHVKISSPSRGFIPKPFKKLPSHDTYQRRRSVDFNDSYDRDFDSEKFVGRDRSGIHMRGRSPARGYFGGWDSRRRPSPIYRGGSHNFGHPRPKSVIEDRGFMNGFDQTSLGPDSHVRKQFSNGAYRGRFRRYRPDGMNHHDFRGVDRAYGGDCNDYHPGRMHHRTGSSRRERSNSPVFRRLHHPYPYRKSSRSRSRSRSPLSWNNNRNRSPGFRPDDRMERVRLPFQKRFPVDQGVGFMSPPRNRMSPSRSSRWFEGRNHDGGEGNNFRGRRSPGRMFRPGPGQRFDSGYSMRRLNSDNHFRPMFRQRRLENNRGRFENNGGGSRGCKYEGCGDEGRGENRYEMVHRGQRDEGNDYGDSIRRLRLNGEEEPVVANSES